MTLNDDGRGGWHPLLGGDTPPIVLTRDKVLVYGRKLVDLAKALDIKTHPAVILDVDSTDPEAAERLADLHAHFVELFGED